MNERNRRNYVLLMRWYIRLGKVNNGRRKIIVGLV